MSDQHPGVLVVDKPAGMTSHGVVAHVRRALGIRKVGHAGTLDPDASGVLVLGLGTATRLLGQVIVHDKEYDAVIRLGASSSTDDASGDLTWTSCEHLTQDMIESATTRFIGDIEQVPSSVSAIKVDGKRAYARVRAGEQVSLPARPVHVEKFVVRSVAPGQTATGEHYLDVSVHVECSSGTYIRALARDLGRDLQSAGHLVHLRRTRVGVFTIDEARAIDNVTSSDVLPLRDVVPRLFPVVTVEPAVATAAHLGQKISIPDLPPGVVALVDGPGDPVALVRADHEHTRYVMVFPSGQGVDGA